MIARESASKLSIATNENRYSSYDLKITHGKDALPELADAQFSVVSFGVL